MEPVVDFELERAGGGARRLRDLRGRVVVLFWEARERLADNDALKRELESVAREEPDVVLLGVGDVRALDLPLVRPIVRQAVAAVARAIGHEILLDWGGTLERPPFGLRHGRSNVMVIDREGRPVLRCVGRVSDLERDQVRDTVRALARRLAA